MFRLRTELLERLKQMAANDNRSLNNFVETILMDAVYHKPNVATVAAMREAEEGKTLTEVDMTSFDTFVSSLGLNEKN